MTDYFKAYVQDKIECPNECVTLNLNEDESHSSSVILEYTGEYRVYDDAIRYDINLEYKCPCCEKTYVIHWATDDYDFEEGALDG